MPGEMPKGSSENWGDVDLNIHKPYSHENHGVRDLHDEYRNYGEAKSETPKIFDKKIQKALGFLLAAGVSLGALSLAYSSSEAQVRAGMEEIDKKMAENLKNDLIQHLAAENVDEATINEILSDPDIISAYEEMRKDHKTFDEYLAEKYPTSALDNTTE